MSRRKRIQTTTETALLTKSARRCAICFGLHGDLSTKGGQIAHLDGNPANNVEDNLAFLCLDHHDEYDSRTSQSMGLTAQEVKAHRDQLYQRVSSGMQDQVQDKDRERRREALLDVLGDIAPDLLTILNEAPHAADRERLAEKMSALHKRLERICPLFHGNTHIQDVLTRLGKLGGSAISPYLPVVPQVFEIYSEHVSALEQELARLNSSL